MYYSDSTEERRRGRGWVMAQSILKDMMQTVSCLDLQRCLGDGFQKLDCEIQVGRINRKN